jgi:hypothetical protein
MRVEGIVERRYRVREYRALEGVPRRGASMSLLPDTSVVESDPDLLRERRLRFIS